MKKKKSDRKWHFHNALCLSETRGMDISMERTLTATALRTRCAERTHTTQHVCMCADAQACANIFTLLFMGICAREDMEVQV